MSGSGARHRSGQRRHGRSHSTAQRLAVGVLLGLAGVLALVVGLTRGGPGGGTQSLTAGSDPASIASAVVQAGVPSGGSPTPEPAAGAVRAQSGQVAAAVGSAGGPAPATRKAAPPTAAGTRRAAVPPPAPVAVVPSAPVTVDPGAAGPGIPGSWKLAFGDTFNGPGLDLTRWQLCNPSFRAMCLPYNDEKETFNTATVGNPNVTVAGGQLHLTATRTGGQIRSGMVSTGPWPAIFGPKPAGYTGFHYTYGYYQGRVRIPAGDGYWPSLWELPQQQQQGGKAWPDTGEYDVFEIPGNNPSDYHFTAHWGGGGGSCGHPCSPQVATISSAATNWHVYGLDWEPTGLTWYLDGHKMGNTVTTPGAIKNYPFYIIANLSVGGSWGPLNGGITGSTPFPATMDIDYLNVWQHP